MASNDAVDAEVIYSILGSPVKRKLITVLAERGPLSFTELKRELGVSVGALYYNLDSLRGFVIRDEARRYCLSEKGFALYEAMKKSGEVIKRTLTPPGQLERALSRYVVPYLVPRQLVMAFYKDVRASAVSLATCLIFGTFSILLTKLRVKLLEVEQTPLLFPKSIGFATITPEIILVSEYALSYLLSLTLAHILALLVARRRSLTLGFAAAIALAYMPLYAYMILHFSITGYAYPSIPYSIMAALAVALRVLQVVSLGLITASVSVFYDTSAERGFLVASILLYISFFAKHLLP